MALDLEAAVDLAGVPTWEEAMDLVLKWVMEVIMEDQDQWEAALGVLE